MRGNRRRIVALSMIAGLVISGMTAIAPQPVRAAGKVKVSSVKVTNVKKKKVTLKKGQSLKLKVKVKVKPNKAKYKKVTFRSANKKIVTVSKKGKLKAKKAGTTKVTVRSKKNKKKKVVIKVTVKNSVNKDEGNKGTGNPVATPTGNGNPATQNPNTGGNTGDSPSVATPTPTATPTATPTPMPTPDGTSKLMRKPFAEQAYVGDTLAEVPVKGGSMQDSNGAEIAGSYEWEEPDTVLTGMGKSHHMVKFVPADKYFAAVEHISITVQTTKNQLTLGLPRAGSVATGKKLNDSLLSGGSAKDEDGQRVAGKFSWANPDELVTTPGTVKYLAVFTPSDSVKYRKEAVYVRVNVTGSAVSGSDQTNVTDGSSLKDAYEGVFGKVGNALVGFQMQDADCISFIKKHYNSVTMGNEMKPDYLLNSWAPSLQASNPEGYVDTSEFTYEYKDSQYPKINLDSIDSYIETAYKNGLKLRYHVFVWHQQTPEWFFKKNYDKNAGYVTPEVMNGRLEYLVRNVMTHIYSYRNADGVYIGREVVDSWDMANEYFHNSDSDRGIKSYWDEVYYPDYKYIKNKHSGIWNPVYIKRAFAIGHSILEDFDMTERASLLYNDYNTYMVADNIVKMINWLNTKDEINPNAETICDGVGMQTHLDMGYPTIESIGPNAIDKFKAAGFEIQLTEMDLTDYSKTETSLANQAKKWYNLMMLLLTEKDSGAKITGIIWWGPSDNHSWRRDGVPLLFSEYWKPKDHYYQAIDSVSWYNMGDTEWQILN